jgi:quercetin dioxygenase-like cupin family protein
VPRVHASKPPDDALRDALGQAICGAIAAAIHPHELAQARRAGMREQVMQRIAAPAPPGTHTVRARDSSGWVAVDDKVSIKVLRMDRPNNNQTVLIRMLPGGVIVPHRHNEEEECLVIEGEIEIGSHLVLAGDMHIASPGAEHAPITTRTGALLMVRSEIPPASFAIV